VLRIEVARTVQVGNEIDCSEEFAVAKPRLAVAASLIGISVFLAGCQHHLIAVPGETTVPVYPNEATYTRISNLKKQGAVGGMIGGLGQDLSTTQMDNNTPVRIISSDDLGATIEVTDGPNRGTDGFVPKNNVQ
jgi:hypothetical protein